MSKVLGVDEIMAAVNSLPEAERSALLARMNEHAANYGTWLTSLRAKLVHRAESYTLHG